VKHTPGPWFIFGNRHCVGGPFVPGPGDDPDQLTAGIAMCGMRLRTADECAANARLIAAAPAMLAALEAALPILHAYIPPDQFDGNAARALILVKEAVAMAKEEPA
jgi:hypothetical protein